MYFDHVQLSLAFGLRFSFPVRVSGIYFRPSFHYSDTGILVGRGNGSRGTDARKRLMLLSAVRNPHFQTLFCLDPFAAEWLREHHPRVRAVDLPDPVDPVPILTPPSNALAGVGASRSKLLLFGALDDRKGVRPVVDALRTLPTEAQARLALVCAGPFIGAARAELLTELEELRTNSAVEVVVEDRYHEESEIQPLVAGADLVLLTYDCHIGSSNVLVRAAAAATPVLAQEYGLLGALVRRHRLGTTLDARSPDAIATALTRWVVDGPSSITFDAASARAFASANISARFTETVFGELLKPSREGTAVESRGLRGS
jgi:glycosyltransferase involved in cell wall biosynthesis